MVANTSVNWQEGVGYSDWVELRNISSQPVELSEYYLTDKKQEKTLWALPQGTLAPGESVIYYCSGNEGFSTLLRTHTNFSLSALGEGLFLYDSAGKPVDWVYLHDVPAEGTMGRAEGENGFYYYTTPTQGGENGPGARMIAAQPEASLPAGVYNDVQELTVELSGGTEIRYTTDGSTPTGESELYTQPILITGTTVIRAVNLVDGQLASDVLTLSYIVNENHTLPVVSLVTDEENLFGPQGIYSNHETAWEQDWEREVSLSFFEEDGGFTIDCGAQIHGQTSRRASEKRSFKVSFRGRYDGPLEYDVFGDGQVTEFTSLLIRGSLEDNYTSYMRDELFADLAAQATDVPAQNYRYVVLYINGEYWGLYSIREHHTEDYFASHYGVDADTVDRQNGTYRRAGAWSDLMAYAEYNDLSQPEAYAYMQSHLDIPEVIDWLILQCYSGNIDVYGNVRFYSSPQWNGGRYVYGLVDMDLTMMGHNTYTVGFDATGQLHGIIPCALLRNETFRDAFLTRTAELLATALSEENVCRTVDKLAAIFQDEVARDLERWGQPADRFTYQVQNIKAYAAVRVGEMVSAARTFFGLSEEQMETYFADLQ